MEVEKNKLTNEEREKVFAMYYGQRVLKFSRTAPATQLMNWFFMGRITNDCVLALTPLELISDEHAIEVGRMEGLSGKGTLEQIKTAINIDTFNLKYPTFIYLINKGYEVPLFFGINHWANGKTAIELNIAIQK